MLMACHNLEKKPDKEEPIINKQSKTETNARWENKYLKFPKILNFATTI